MHDIDRAMFEYEQEAFESGESHEAFESHESLESSHEAEAQEMELAGRLLEVANEQQLEQFLGNVLSSAASAARSFAGSATGRALGGVLKDAARNVLPQVGGIIGGAIGGDLGNQLGQGAGRWLGGKFELEGLSAEDREFELARAFVRVAEDATRIAESSPQLEPQQAATNAVLTAARKSMPGLVPLIAGGSGTRGSARGGRWVRSRNRIIIIGA